MSWIDDLEALGEEAPPGPWDHNFSGIWTEQWQTEDGTWVALEDDPELPVTSLTGPHKNAPPTEHWNEFARFTITARNHWPQIIAALRAAEDWSRADHIAWFGEDRWTLRHPLSCDLDICPVHDVLDDYCAEGPPLQQGYWTADVVEGDLVLGVCLGSERPPNSRDDLRRALAALSEAVTRP